jgi:NADPH-dependent 2,4-dienoyl-CoA reductase/sulfur reductase-like enzyme
MSSHGHDVIVVGAGPAGLAAACRAAECGATVALLDDNPHPGGQIWRAGARPPKGKAARWLRLAGERNVGWIAAARVFVAPAPGWISLERSNGNLELGYRNLVLATGARERFLPFPGWTLPNVMGAGGLQALAKSGFPVKGTRVVVAGTGPLLLAVAKYLRGLGANVRLVAEQTDPSALYRFARCLARRPAKLAQAVFLRAALLGVPYLAGCWPVAAQGRDKLESVTLRRGGKTWSVPCDYLTCAFGLVPNLELAALLGCRMGEAGVEVDEYQQTSVAGVYCAGQATGIGGLDLSLAEGEIAGYAAAGRPEAARKLFRARQSHRRFAAALDQAFAPRPELRSLPQDDTLVCRCEDVGWGPIRGFSSWREAKLQTRCGMGPCQGRVCGGAVEFLLGWKPDSVRPPVFPARIESLTEAFSDRQSAISRAGVAES